MKLTAESRLATMMRTEQLRRGWHDMEWSVEYKPEADNLGSCNPPGIEPQYWRPLLLTIRRPGHDDWSMWNEELVSTISQAEFSEVLTKWEY